MTNWHNPMVSGFNPDPSVVLVDGLYYLVTSSFEYVPGRYVGDADLRLPHRDVADLDPVDQIGAAVHRQAGQVLERRGDEVVQAIHPHDAGIGVEPGHHRVVPVGHRTPLRRERATWAA